MKHPVLLRRGADPASDRARRTRNREPGDHVSAFRTLPLCVRASRFMPSACQPPHRTRTRKIMHVLDDAEVGRIRVISAHPDDVDFGAAGTVARWTDAGIEVVYCVVTDGDAGGSDPGVSRSDMAVLRRGEQTDAARQVGVHDLRFLGYPDGRVEATLDLRRDLARMIRRDRPGPGVFPSPGREYVPPGLRHPHHPRVGTVQTVTVRPTA